jgi:hypothetical protein
MSTAIVSISFVFAYKMLFSASFHILLGDFVLAWSLVAVMSMPFAVVLLQAIFVMQVCRLFSFARLNRCSASSYGRNVSNDQGQSAHQHSSVFCIVCSLLFIPSRSSPIRYTEHPPPKYVIFMEINLTSENFMREITAIEPSWLSELAPHYYKVGGIYIHQISLTVLVCCQSCRRSSWKAR